ncbi:MAG: hypothetical protein JXB50_12790 [Spirochaetes bacterium]|nr:hypothetical protein [Spirochaetota bacterium]
MRLKKHLLIILNFIAICSFICANETSNKNENKTDQLCNLQNLSFRTKNSGDKLINYAKISKGFLSMGITGISLIASGVPYTILNAIYINYSPYLTYGLLLFGPILYCLPFLLTGVPFTLLGFIFHNYFRTKKAVNPFIKYNRNNGVSTIGIKFKFA